MGDGMIDLSKKRALIIDDSPAMCSSLRTTLSNFGITRCEMSNSANEAVFRIRQRDFDLIVCDYCLGDGSDGQQILEQLRKGALIAPTVAFLMVTAERGYEKVVSCAELAPDDYLLKPFTAETMRIRVERVFEKKDVFAPIYQLITAGKAEEAIIECDRILELKNKFAIDLIRLKGELLITLGRHEAARLLYEQIIAARAIPWARIGLAKTLSMTGQSAEAIETLELAIADTPQYLEAYDLLAQAHEQQGNAELAQNILEKAIEISPNTLSRHTLMGEMAYRNGDMETAQKAFGLVVNKGKYSFSRSHHDYVNLSRALLDDNKYEEALNTISDAKKSFENTPELELASSVMESLIYQGTDRHAESHQALSKALEVRKEHGLRLSDAVSIDLAKSCFLNDEVDEARALVKDVVSNFYDDEKIQKMVRQMLDKVGRGNESQDLIENSVTEVIKLNNEGVLRAKNGDLAGAIDLLVAASKRMPENVQVALNAAHALIVDSDRNGWNEANMFLARGFINEHVAKHANLDKFQKVSALFKEVSLKFGVKVA